ncbi:unnamed protein product [Prunus armeniaca]|uniref:Uncharacterized protein n=1 Tax=Prunus armeniaca TaxID=36596 RepID=A0A6J5WE57_PRUAR|nr:unnamed protein product [Prunus armeniaca]
MSVKIVHAKLTDVDDGQWFGFKVAAGIVNALRRGRLELEAECLRILQNNFNIKTHTFAPDRVILEALQNCSLGQAKGLRQAHNLYMSFVKSKKNEAVQLGAQALDLKLPFEEIEIGQYPPFPGTKYFLSGGDTKLGTNSVIDMVA